MKKVAVEIPQPLVLTGADKISLILHEAGGGAFVTVDAYGVISYIGNGGGAPRFMISLERIADDLQSAVTRLPS